MDNKKFIGVLFAATLISGLIGGYIGGLVGGNNQSAELGASTPGTRWPHGITVGLPSYSPTNLALLSAGTCSSITVPIGNTTASTTQPFSCAATQAISGDVVFLSFATSTAASPQWGATSPIWEIQAAKASSTAGSIEGVALNQTGGAAQLTSSGIASTTYYQIWRAQ